MVTYCLAQNGIHKTFPFEGCKSFVFVLCFALNKTKTHFFLYLLSQNYVQSWTGPCITPSPCINVAFPPSTTNNIEIFCTLHAVNNST